MPLQMKSAAAITVRRDVRSASQAAGSTARKWTTANDGPSSMPIWASPSSRSVLMNGTSIDTIVRSITLNAETRKTTPIAYQTYARE